MVLNLMFEVIKLPLMLDHDYYFLSGTIAHSTDAKRSIKAKIVIQRK